jgi:hypothetical protein
MTEPVDFETSVLKSEHESINQRRTKFGIAPVQEIHSAPKGSPAAYDTVGLALSGGGIRSAAIALGILQALHRWRVLQKVDYLSTVSGGGYMGSSLTTTMTKTEGKFVFAEDSHGVSPLDQKSEPMDTLAVAHLRNHSNYLRGTGKHNIGSAIAIIVRGVLANMPLFGSGSSDRTPTTSRRARQLRSKTPKSGRHASTMRLALCPRTL